MRNFLKTWPTSSLQRIDNRLRSFLGDRLIHFFDTHARAIQDDKHFSGITPENLNLVELAKMLPAIHMWQLRTLPAEKRNSFSISMTSENIPVWFWIFDDSEAIFLIPILEGNLVARGFSTRDAAFIEGLKLLANSYVNSTIDQNSDINLKSNGERPS